MYVLQSLFWCHSFFLLRSQHTSSATFSSSCFEVWCDPAERQKVLQKTSGKSRGRCCRFCATWAFLCRLGATVASELKARGYPCQYGFTGKELWWKSWISSTTATCFFNGAGEPCLVYPRDGLLHVTYLRDGKKLFIQNLFLRCLEVFRLLWLID